MKKIRLLHGIFTSGIIMLFMVPLVPVFAVEYGGTGGRPAYPDPDNPRTQSIFVYTLERGAEIEDGIKVINNTADTKTLLVYAADSTPSTGGAFACKQLAENKVGVGAWIELEKTEVTLESNTSEIVPFIMNVPGSAGVGEHNGCILIQEKKEATDKVGVRLSFRTGLRVAVTIPGEIVRKLEIVDFKVTVRDDGGFLLHPEVKNTGNVSIDTSIKVVTRYFFGTLLAEQGGTFPILREDISNWNFELKKPFWGGWYTSTFSIEYDESLDAGVGVETSGELTFISGPSISFFSFPEPVALAIEVMVLAAVLFALFLLIVSMRRKKWIADKWLEITVQKGDSINTLADEYNVSWKLLAKANKLKAPFVVDQGDSIKVPPKMTRPSDADFSIEKDMEDRHNKVAGKQKEGKGATKKTKTHAKSKNTKKAGRKRGGKAE